MNSNDHKCIICGKPIDTEHDAFSAYTSNRDDVQSILAHNACVEAFNSLDSEQGQRIQKAAKRQARLIALASQMDEQEERDEEHAQLLAQFGRLSEDEQSELYDQFVKKHVRSR